MTRAKPLLLAALVLAGGMAAAIALPHDGLASLLDLTAERLPPPPELRLRSPAEGEGVAANATLVGEAHAVGGDVIDVQYRLDGGRWTSVPEAPRGQPVVPFAATIPIPPGEHLLEVRAWDGDAYSLPARALVRRDAPTLRILSPADGASMPAGLVDVSGTLVGGASRVLVSVGNETWPASFGVGGAWSATVAVPRGVHAVTAVAIAEVPSLPARVVVAAGSPVPPAISLLTPREGASYGEAGDLACGGGCILLSGTAERAARIAIAIDGHPARDADLLADGTWTFRLPVAGLATGPHEAVATPFGHDNASGAPRSVRFLARTPIELAILGDTAAQPTGTPLRFQAEGPGADAARWTLDGVEVGAGPELHLTIATPGDHVLAARVDARGGRGATTTLPVHAINRPPDLELAAEPELVGARMRFALDARDADGRIVEYQWDFGDGATATSAEPTIEHRYPTRGIYAASVTAVDDAGGLTTLGTLVGVPNVPPLLAFSWEPAAPTVHDVIMLRDESEDHDGAIMGRAWTLPDGNTTSDEAPVLRFATAGEHAVTLRAFDDLDAFSTLTRNITVVNLPPDVRPVHEPAAPRTHEEVLFTDLSVDVDTPIASRAWDFGDGTNATGEAVLHTFTAPGNYTVRLTVTDTLGGVANATIEVVVADTEPTIRAVIVDPPAPRAGEPVRLEAIATDRDGNIVEAAWELGDGNTTNETMPLHRYARSGHYAGRVSVVDASGLRASLPFHVTVANAPPTVALRANGTPLAAFPTLLVAEAEDVGGEVRLYRFDADSDGRFDCVTTAPACAHVYLASGVHAAQVWAEDDEGAISTAHAIVEVGTPPSHLAPPDILVESPLPDAILRGEQLFRGEARGVRPIVRVEIQVQNGTWSFSGAGTSWRLAEGAEDWRALVDTSRFPDGPFDLVIRATDAGGGVGETRIPVLVDNGPRASDVTVRIVDAPRVLEQSAFARVSAFHPMGVTSARWRIDDGPWQAIAHSPLAFLVELDRDSLRAGEHVLQVEAYRGTTESARAEHVFLVPGSAPALVVDEAPPSVAYGLIRASGRIVGDGHAQWRLDHDLWRDIPLAARASWLLAEETMDMRGGPHELHLRAVSPDGRLASEVRTYRIEIVNPSADRLHGEDPPARPRTAQEIPFPWALPALAALAAAWLRRAPRRP